MSVKGCWKRPKNIQDYLNELMWALASSKTDDDTKEKISRLLDIRQGIQQKIADINTSEEDRAIYRKVIAGDLPVVTNNVIPSGMFFPWSSIPGIKKYVESKDFLVTDLVSAGECDA